MRRLLPLLLLAGCASSYESRYSFAPSPHEILVQPEGAELPVARILVSVRGVRSPDSDLGIPLSTEVRMRVENLTDVPVLVQRGEFVLVDADLTSFGPPRIDVPGDLFAMPAETLSLVLHFPFPPETKPEDLALEGLNLRLALRWNEERGAIVSATFERVVRMDPYYWGPHYGYPYGYSAFCY